MQALDIPFDIIPIEIWNLVLRFLDSKSIFYFSLCSKTVHEIWANLDWVGLCSKWNIPSDVKKSSKLYHLVSAIESDSAKHKPLPLLALSTDGGEYLSSYGLKNITSRTGRAYCTQRSENVNVVLKLDSSYIENVDERDLLMFITKAEIEDPHFGYTAPIDTSLLYVSLDEPDVSSTNSHKFLTKELYQSMYAPLNVVDRQRAQQPILFSSCLERNQAKRNQFPDEEIPEYVFPLDQVVAGKYIQLSM
eukprot:TRINITY_DN6193_c0_g1_i1.p1 TRINITY_DN6193_c0_g1~~TRINITY_DN6193_c0_g1_i1.p1  ORF type:complete len:248 (+),score=35.56 TRINITY_DN6193_c0_g1_i1:906-1649(+)